MRVIKFFLLITMAIFATSVSAQASSFTFFNGQSVFLGATSGLPSFSEGFDARLEPNSLNQRANFASGISVFTTNRLILTNSAALSGLNLSVVTNATFSLPTPVAGLGFFLTDFGDDFGLSNLSFAVNGSETFTTILENFSTGPGGNTFIGLLFEEAVETITFVNSQPGDGFGFDELTAFTQASAITAVPEPGTWLLMIFGFAAVAVALRGRARKTSMQTI